MFEWSWRYDVSMVDRRYSWRNSHSNNSIMIVLFHIDPPTNEKSTKKNEFFPLSLSLLLIWSFLPLLFIPNTKCRIYSISTLQFFLSTFSFQIISYWNNLSKECGSFAFFLALKTVCSWKSAAIFQVFSLSLFWLSLESIKKQDRNIHNIHCNCARRHSFSW